MRHRWQVVAVGCVLALGLGACASGGSGVDTVTAGHRTLAGNRHAAERAAADLLAMTPVPSGAKTVAHPPKGVSQAPMTPAVQSLVDKGRVWLVPMDYASAAAWARQHPPAGLGSASGSGSSGGPDFQAQSWTYDRADSPGVTGQQLLVEVATRDATTSYLRADGQAIWLDPRPYRDGATGKRLRVTVAGGCPGDDRGYVGVRNDDAALRDALLPSGEPTAAVACGYNGMNGRPFSLRAQHVFDGPAASRLAAAARRIDLSHEVGAESSCPNDDGSAAVIALSFRGRPDADLWLPVGGCALIANGFIAASPGSFTEALSSAAPGVVR